MNKDKIKRYLFDKHYRTLINANLGLYNYLSDKSFLEKKFQAEFGYALNFDNPQTFNEKLQWLKLYDHNPSYIKMVDKYKVREYIAQKIGEEYLIPLLGVWDSPDEIDFDSLPQRFVLKCNHNSGLGMCICKDKTGLNYVKVKKNLKKGLKENYFAHGREWPYKDVPRKIICEKYITDNGSDEVLTDELKDYKLMCFNGKVKCSFVCADRFTGKGLHLSFFDRDWKEMPFERVYPRIENEVPKPINYDLMVSLAEKLSESIPFVRVDFYESGGRVYFGELTFFPGGGYEPFSPQEWDLTLGNWIELPQKDGRK